LQGPLRATREEEEEEEEEDDLVKKFKYRGGKEGRVEFMKPVG